MRLGLALVGAHPGDFFFKLYDPGIKLCPRVRIETFLGKKARGVTLAGGKIIVIHVCRIERVALQVNHPLQ